MHTHILLFNTIPIFVPKSYSSVWIYLISFAEIYCILKLMKSIPIVFLFG